MRLLTVLSCCVLITMPIYAQAGKEDKPRFATKGEINLLLTQTERALGNYDDAIKMELSEFGPSSGADKDAEEARNFRDVLSKLKRQPDLFNGPFGFLLIVNLDDVTHNMSVCSGQAVTLSVNDLMEQKVDEANRKLHISQVCRDAETLFYTISENAVNLYSAVLLENNELLQKASEAADLVQKCTEILKRSAQPKE